MFIIHKNVSDSKVMIDHTMTTTTHTIWIWGKAINNYAKTTTQKNFKSHSFY